MRIIVEYYFYENAYGGTAISESESCKLMNDAEAYVNGITHGRIRKYDLNDEDKEMVKLAICAVADKLKEYEKYGRVSSENTDGYTVSYTAKDIETQQVEKYNAARGYLIDTTLLYGGVNYDYQR